MVDVELWRPEAISIRILRNPVNPWEFVTLANASTVIFFSNSVYVPMKQIIYLSMMDKNEKQNKTYKILLTY